MYAKTKSRSLKFITHISKNLTIVLDKIQYLLAASKKGRYSYKRKYEYIRRTKNESALPVIPAFPAGVIDDIILMASHISDLFLACKTYKPDFFQKLKEIETQYLVRFLRAFLLIVEHT